jgi:hypothetical protein
MSNSLIITSNNSIVSNQNSTFTLRLPRSITFTNKEIGLVSSQFYYSNENIKASYGNNTFAINYTRNSINSTLNITLPDGYYSYSDLNSYIHLEFDKANIWWLDADGVRVYPLELVANPVYYSATISFIFFPTFPSGYTNPNNLATNQNVSMTIPEKFGKIIGFEGDLLPDESLSVPTSFNSSKTPEISPVSAYSIATNLVNDINFNTEFSDSVAVFNSGSTRYGALITENPSVISFYPVADGTYSSIIVSIRDQTNTAIVPMKDASGSLFKFLIRDRE